MNKKRIETIERLKEIALKSSPVVAWYHHGYEGQVRGPWNRWFTCQLGSYNREEYIERHGIELDKDPVSSVADDVEFCAAAMNNLLPLIIEVESLESELKKLRIDKQKLIEGLENLYTITKYDIIKQLLKEVN